LLLTVTTVDAPVTRDTFVCTGGNIQLQVSCNDTVYWSTTPSPGGIFQAGLTLTLTSVTTPVKYYLQSRNGPCSSAWDSLEVAVVLIADPLTSDTTVCGNVPFSLHAAGPDTLLWSHVPAYGQAFHSGPVLNVPGLSAPQTYYLYVQSGSCRSNIVSLGVAVDVACHSFAVPSVFTPNGDGLNDHFPEPPGDYKFDIRIFNRWGVPVFSGDGMVTGWDGRSDDGNKVPDGTYYYTLRVVFQDNFSREFYGHLLVLNNP
jgi:gliding motility-associated-like protein